MGTAEIILAGGGAWRSRSAVQSYDFSANAESFSRTLPRVHAKMGG